MPNPTCRVCNRTVADLLSHLAMHHNVRAMDDYNALLEAQEREEKRAQDFRSYVEVQRRLLEDGKITGEEYRARITMWEKSHANEQG